MNRNTDWRVAGASVIGTRHEQAAGRCEDAWAAAGRPAVRAASVCDGAGSAPFGYAGAALVSQLTARWLVAHFDEAVAADPDDVRMKLFPAIRRAVRRVARRAGCPAWTFSCTMLAVAAADDGRWLAVHIGDGGIAAEVGGGLRLISAPQKGRYANETTFVTTRRFEDAFDRFRVVRSADGDGPAPTGFALFTDGVEDSVIDRATGSPAAALAGMFGWLRDHPEEVVGDALQDNLHAVFRERTDDDCTLVLFARSPVPGGDPREDPQACVDVPRGGHGQSRDPAVDESTLTEAQHV